MAAHKALGLIKVVVSAVLAEFRISVRAAPVKYRTNFVDLKSDDILLLRNFKPLINKPIPTQTRRKSLIFYQKPTKAARNYPERKGI